MTQLNGGWKMQCECKGTKNNKHHIYLFVDEFGALWIYMQFEFC